MKKTVLLLSLLATSLAASAQCPTPRLLLNDQEVPAAPADAFKPVKLRLLDVHDCPDVSTYEVQTVEVSLIRGRRPLQPTRRVTGSILDLAAWQTLSRPGDRLYIEVKEAAVHDKQGGKKKYAGEPVTYNWVL